MSIPRYSIITVCLNAKEAFKKTLYSIEQQTFKDFEWIVVDGGSTDGTVELVQNHPCVNRLISEPDEGIYDAMNKGIYASSGEYLLFLNAGDWLYRKETLMESEEIMKGISDDIVIGELMVIDHENKFNLRDYRKRFIDKKYFYNYTLPHPSTFIKREVFQKYGLYCKKFKIRGDHDFFARVILNGASFSFLSICITFFPLNGLSFQMKKSELLKNELMLVRKRNYSIVYRFKKSLINFYTHFQR